MAAEGADAIQLEKTGLQPRLEMEMFPCVKGGERMRQGGGGF